MDTVNVEHVLRAAVNIFNDESQRLSNAIYHLVQEDAMKGTAQSTTEQTDSATTVQKSTKGEQQKRDKQLDSTSSMNQKDHMCLH